MRFKNDLNCGLGEYWKSRRVSIVYFKFRDINWIFINRLKLKINSHVLKAKLFIWYDLFCKGWGGSFSLRLLPVCLVRDFELELYFLSSSSWICGYRFYIWRPALVNNCRLLLFETLKKYKHGNVSWTLAFNKDCTCGTPVPFGLYMLWLWILFYFIV